MIRAVVLSLWPFAACGQTAWVDQPYIQGCFANTPPDQVGSTCVGLAANACQTAPGNSSTLGITGCLQAETAVWDGLLNATYQTKLAELAAQDPSLSDQLRATQRAWIAFRDAECGLRYAIWGNGSMRTIAGAQCQLSETAERALELRDLGNME